MCKRMPACQDRGVTLCMRPLLQGFKPVKKRQRLTSSDQLQVTGLKREIMAIWGGKEVKELLLRAESEVNWRVSGSIGKKVDITQMLTLSLLQHPYLKHCIPPKAFSYRSDHERQVIVTNLSIKYYNILTENSVCVCIYNIFEYVLL